MFARAVNVCHTSELYTCVQSGRKILHRMYFTTIKNKQMKVSNQVTKTRNSQNGQGPLGRDPRPPAGLCGSETSLVLGSFSPPATKPKDRTCSFSDVL